MITDARSAVPDHASIFGSLAWPVDEDLSSLLLLLTTIVGYLCSIFEVIMPPLSCVFS
jgi:hypothetical protein